MSCQPDMTPRPVVTITCTPEQAEVYLSAPKLVWTLAELLGEFRQNIKYAPTDAPKVRLDTLEEAQEWLFSLLRDNNVDLDALSEVEL